jgi:hypothetical protein
MTEFVGTETPPVPLRCNSFQEGVMDNSVHQERWMLAPVLGLCIIIISAGFVLS